MFKAKYLTLIRRFFNFFLKNFLFCSCDLLIEWVRTIWTILNSFERRLQKIISLKFGKCAVIVFREEIY
jgi:hypothetical protein